MTVRQKRILLAIGAGLAVPLVALVILVVTALLTGPRYCDHSGHHCYTIFI